MSPPLPPGFHRSSRALGPWQVWVFLAILGLPSRVSGDVGFIEGISRRDDSVIVEWTGGGYLQRASSLQGPWNSIYLAEDLRPRRFDAKDPMVFFRIYQSPVEQQLDELAHLRRDLESTDPAIQSRARIRREELSNDPGWGEALSLERFFDIAEALGQGKGTPEQTALLSRNIPAILVEQQRARMGSDPGVQALRESFERAVSMALLSPGPLRDPIDAELGRISAKVLDYVVQTRAGDRVGMERALYDLHSDVSSGFGGSLRTPAMVEAAEEGHFEDSTRVLLEVLRNGNIRERFRMLIRFLMLMGRDALDDTSAAHPVLVRIAADPDVAGTFQFGAREAKRLLDRVLLYRLEHPAPWQQTITSSNVLEVFYPTLEEAMPGTRIHADHAKARTERYQAKLPGLFRGDVYRFLGLPSPAAPEERTADAENNPLARTLFLTVRQGQQRGFFLSSREIDDLGGWDARMDWAVGTRANLVLPSSDFVASALRASLPIKCGVSGTTYRVMSSARILGGDPVLVRLAVIAALQSSDSHSFHEIGTSAKGFGAPYDPLKPYSNLGISESVLEAIAASLGTTLAELNGGSTAPGVDSRESRSRSKGPAWGRIPMAENQPVGWGAPWSGDVPTDLIEPRGVTRRASRSFLLQGRSR